VPRKPGKLALSITPIDNREIIKSTAIALIWVKPDDDGESPRKPKKKQEKKSKE